MLTLEHLRPHNSQVLSKEFLEKHERLASYSYTAFCRIAATRQCLLDLCSHLESTHHISMFHILNAFEAFHLFFGSALENIGGAGNIILGHSCKEDSYSSFLKSFRDSPTSTNLNPEVMEVLDAARSIKENYRDHISHRSRLASLGASHEGRNIPSFESEFKKRGCAKEQRSWRKTLREIAEGRCETMPAPDLCAKHLGILERAGDAVFAICLQEAGAYFSANSAHIAENPEEFEIDIATVPEDASYVLFKCKAEKQLHLNTWYHPIASRPFPSNCVNGWCKSQEIVAMYYVSA